LLGLLVGQWSSSIPDGQFSVLLLAVGFREFCDGECVRFRR
jgi:hypothetical protein